MGPGGKPVSNQMCLAYPLADQSPGFVIHTRLGGEWNRLRVAWYSLASHQKVERAFLSRCFFSSHLLV